jgi:hypothetical protein
MNVEFGMRNAEMDVSAWLILILSPCRIPTSQFLRYLSPPVGFCALSRIENPVS